MAPLPDQISNGRREAPDSLLAQLRERAAAERARRTLTLELPGRWAGMLRARYGVLALAELERYGDGDTTRINGLRMTMDMVARACQAIEAHDPDSGEWFPLRDSIGPVGFDDRLTRLLGWPRADEALEYTTAEVYDGMFDGNGAAVTAHIGRVAVWMQEETVPGEAV